VGNDDTIVDAVEARDRDGVKRLSRELADLTGQP